MTDEEEREEELSLITTILLVIMAAPIAILIGIAFYLMFFTGD